MRRPEHPYQQEIDDRNAAGMKPCCPVPLDLSISHLRDNRTCFFLYLSYNSNGKCLLCRGMPVAFRGDASRPPEQADTNRIRITDEQASSSPCGHIEALRAGRYGGASYPAPISLAAVVVPTAGRAAKPPVPLSRSTLFPCSSEEPQHRRTDNQG